MTGDNIEQSEEWDGFARQKAAELAHRTRLRSGSQKSEPPIDSVIVPAPEAVLASFRTDWSAAAPALRLTLETMDEQTWAAWDADVHASKHVFNRYGCFYHDAILHERFSGRWRRCVAVLEPMALQIVRTLDDLIAGLVVLLEGREKPLEGGPRVNGVSMARLLDAVGNYARHHQEWRNSWRGCIPFQPQQTRSILVLASGLSLDASTSETAFAGLVATERPTLRILDSMTDFDLASFRSNFEALELKMMACATDVVAQCLPTYKQRLWRLGLRAYKIRREERLWCERAMHIYPAFIAALDERVREFLPGSVTLTCRGLEKGTPVWTNGFTYVSMGHDGGTDAGFIQGRGTGDSAVVFADEITEDVWEIDMAHVDFVAAHYLADWLACDHLDEEDYPAFAEGYIPSWERFKRQEETSPEAASQAPSTVLGTV